MIGRTVCNLLDQEGEAECSVFLILLLYVKIYVWV